MTDVKMLYEQRRTILTISKQLKQLEELVLKQHETIQFQNKALLKLKEDGIDIEKVFASIDVPAVPEENK